MTKLKAHWLDATMLSGCDYTLCTSEELFKEKLKEIKCPNFRPVEFLSTDANACTHSIGNSVIVTMRDNKAFSEFQTIGILVHEAVHVWQNFCEYLGEDNPGWELEAYAIQNISYCLIQEFYRQRKANTPTIS